MNSPQNQLSVRALFPLPCKNRGISHICVSVCRNMRSELMDLRLYTTRVSVGQRREDFVYARLPKICSFIPYNMIRKWASVVTEERFLRSIAPGNVAYLWSDCSLDLFHRLKSAGAIVVREKYNCHMATAKRILDAEYNRIGLKTGHSITADWIAREQEQLALADMICCPSPMVGESMVENGIGRGKLIDSSYGWSPERFASNGDHVRKSDALTVMFVGSVCVRKGAHLLLEAWARSGIKGRLLLVGAVEEALATRYAELLNREDVTVTGFLADPAPMFREADIFAFPSLEEGDPLVSYEAAAHGLPMLVSPMGAGRGVRDKQEGLVVDPLNQEAWVEALQLLAGDVELRRKYGAAAKERAEQFTWQRVGARLGESLRKRLSLERVNGHAAHSAAMPAPF